MASMLTGRGSGGRIRTLSRVAPLPAAAAFSLSVLYGLVVMASGVPGGVIWLMMRRVTPTVASAEIGPYSHE